MTENRFSNWYILLLIVVVLPIYPLLLQKGILIQHDIFASDLLHNQFPYRVFLGDWISKGIFPLWMPGVFSGVPFLSQIEAGALFLPNWVFFGLFDPYVGLNLSIVFTFLLGAVGTFFLARVYGADNISASIAGVIFSLSGFNISHIKHMNMHEAAAILPWMVLCMENVLRSKTSLWYVLLSVFLGLQITAGHPQITYYSVLFLCARFAVHLVRETLGGRDRLGREVVYRLAKKALGVTVSIILGFGICAVQLIPALKFNELSIRGQGLDWRFASAFPYYVRDILTFVYPAANGTVERMDYRGTIEWENYGYLGIVPLALIVSSLLFVRRKVVWFYLAAILVAMLLVVGPATPFYRGLWEFLPGMKLFRFPTRFLLIVALSGAILSSIVTTHLAKRFLRNRAPSTVKIALVLILCVVFADLCYWQKMRMPIDDLKEWRKETPVVSAIEKRNAEGRIYCLYGPEIWQRAFIESKGFLGGFELYRAAGEVPFGNLSVVHDLANAEGYTNMINERTASFWLWYNTGLLAHSFQPQKYDTKAQRITDQFASLLDIAHVRYLLSPLPVGNENYVLLQDGRFKLYENRTAFPRAYLAYAWNGVENIEEAARWVVQKDRGLVPAIEGDGSSRPDSTRTISEVPVNMITPNRFEFELRPETDGYLIFTDSFDPGWRAEVDGIPVEVHPANGYQQAVKVGADSKRVVLKYRPEGLRTGGVISIVSLLSLVAWVTIAWRRSTFR